MDKNWLKARVAGVAKALTVAKDKAVNCAWIVGTTVLVVAYPLALSILDDRAVRKLQGR